MNKALGPELQASVFEADIQAATVLIAMIDGPWRRENPLLELAAQHLVPVVIQID